ncbi:MAG: hypothetical protein FD174_1210 [Geobacteraceae bacterium]|nr:MAG: hypothetical protein FD174_1210 [Geobacteraceae bacterium]
MITLYKYRPFNDFLKPIILSQKIWFPTRARLNDPEDLQLNLINDVDAEIYRQHLISRAEEISMPRKLLKYNLKRGFAANGEISAEAKKKIGRSQTILQQQFDSLGILSLSDAKNSSVLWERYGDQEKGVCISFRMEVTETLVKVEYETPRPQLRLSELLLCPHADKVLIKILKTKTTKWSEESEWRYFLKKGNNEFPFLGAIETIMLGKKMSDANRQIIAHWVAAANRPIVIEE